MRRAVLLTLMLAGPLAAAQSEPSVSARAEPDVVEVGQPFVIIVRSAGSSVREPQLPEVPGIEIDPQPRHRSTRTTFDLGRGAWTTSERGYLARARREGAFEIPPISVEIDGRIFQTNPVKVTVAAPGQAPVQQRQPQQPSPDPFDRARSRLEGISGGRRATEPARNEAEVSWDDIVFVRAETDKKEVYENEPIRLTLELWAYVGARIRALDRTPFEYPPLEGFYVSKLEPRQREERRGPLTYQVTEIPADIYPTRTGELTIGAWAWQARVSVPSPDFWSPQQHDFDLRADPITIISKPLPAPPANFSGAVGTFDVEAHVDPLEVVQNVPVELTIDIVGAGNPDAIKAPPLPPMERVYIDGPEVTTANSEEPGQGTILRKRFVYSITPLSAPALDIPLIDFIYFDPARGEYVTRKLGPFHVNVLEAGGRRPRIVVDQNALNDNGAIALLTEDIMPPVRSDHTLRPPRLGAASITVIAITPPLGYAALALVILRKRRFAENRELARRHFAATKGHKRLRKVLGHREPAEELFRAVAGFIADKLNAPEQGMTSADAQRLLTESGLDGEAAANLVKTLRACERARYAGVRLSEQELHALVDAADVNMDRLDAEIKRGTRAS